MAEQIQNPLMMYKHPGRHEIHGNFFDYTIIEDNEESIENAKEYGWCMSTSEALENYEELKTSESNTKPVNGSW